MNEEENIEQVVTLKPKKRYPLIDTAVKRAIMEAQYQNFLKKQLDKMVQHENTGP